MLQPVGRIHKDSDRSACGCSERCLLCLILHDERGRAASVLAPQARHAACPFVKGFDAQVCLVRSKGQHAAI